MFENPRRGRQASKKFYNKCSENSRSQIFFSNRYFPKIDVGCPCKVLVKKTDTEYLNYYPIAMLVFFRGNLVSSISRLSDKQFNEQLNNGEPNNKS